jgi:hypothetical protein
MELSALGGVIVDWVQHRFGVSVTVMHTKSDIN